MSIFIVVFSEFLCLSMGGVAHLSLVKNKTTTEQ